MDDLASADPRSRRRAADALRVMGSRAASPLVAAAVGRERDADVKVALLSALGALAGPAAVDVAARELGDPRPAVRGAALDAVAALAGERRRAAAARGARRREPARAAPRGPAARLLPGPRRRGGAARRALRSRPRRGAGRGAGALRTPHGDGARRRWPARSTTARSRSGAIASTSVARWSGESVAAAAPAEDRRRAARRIAEKLSAVGATALRDAVVLANPDADPAPAARPSRGGPAARLRRPRPAPRAAPPGAGGRTRRSSRRGPRTRGPRRGGGARGALRRASPRSRARCSWSSAPPCADGRPRRLPRSSPAERTGRSPPSSHAAPRSSAARGTSRPRSPTHGEPEIHVEAPLGALRAHAQAGGRDRGTPRRLRTEGPRHAPQGGPPPARRLPAPQAALPQLQGRHRQDLALDLLRVPARRARLQGAGARPRQPGARHACLGEEGGSFTKTLYDVLVRKAPLSEVTIETKMPGLWLVPANLAMSTMDLALMPHGRAGVQAPQRAARGRGELRLRGHGRAALLRAAQPERAHGGERPRHAGARRLPLLRRAAAPLRDHAGAGGGPLPPAREHLHLRERLQPDLPASPGRRSTRCASTTPSTCSTAWSGSAPSSPRRPARAARCSGTTPTPRAPWTSSRCSSRCWGGSATGLPPRRTQRGARDEKGLRRQRAEAEAPAAPHRRGHPRAEMEAPPAAEEAVPVAAEEAVATPVEVEPVPAACAGRRPGPGCPDLPHRPGRRPRRRSRGGAPGSGGSRRRAPGRVRRPGRAQGAAREDQAEGGRGGPEGNAGRRAARARPRRGERALAGRPTSTGSWPAPASSRRRCAPTCRRPAPRWPARPARPRARASGSARSRRSSRTGAA